MSQDVLRMLTGPIVLTSANRSGQPDAVTAQEVVEYLDGDVALVLDDGPCRYGQPSSVVRVKNNQFEILREGVVGEATLKRLAGIMVSVRLHGQYLPQPDGRAADAQTLWPSSLKCTLDELEERGVVVMSAGIAAAPGCPPTSEAVQVMREQGLDLSPHEAQPLTEQLVRHADLILAMTKATCNRSSNAGRAAGRTSLLMPDRDDVADPIGQTVGAYRHCAAQLAAGVKHHAEQNLQVELIAARHRCILDHSILTIRQRILQPLTLSPPHESCHCQ